MAMYLSEQTFPSQPTGQTPNFQKSVDQKKTWSKEHTSES